MWACVNEDTVKLLVVGTYIIKRELVVDVIAIFNSICKESSKVNSNWSPLVWAACLCLKYFYWLIQFFELKWISASIT